MLRILQPHIGPDGAPIAAAVDAVAKTNMAATDVFTGSNPDDIRVCWIDRDTPDGVDFLSVKQWMPGDPGIGGLPYPTGTHRHIPGTRVFGINGDIRNPSRHESGTYTPES